VSKSKFIAQGIIFFSLMTFCSSLCGDLLIDPFGGTVLFDDSSTFDDEVTNPRPLGFTGSFFGDSQTTIDICTNGQANFSNNDDYDNATFPNTTAYICPLWSDLIIVQGDGASMTEKIAGGTYYSTTWESIQDYDTELLRYTMQLVWFGDSHTINGFAFQENDIAFSYEAPITALPEGDATIGLNRGNGADFVSLRGVSNGYLSDSVIPLIPTSQDSFLLFRPDGAGNYIPFIAAPILQNTGSQIIPTTANFIVINNAQTSGVDNTVNSLTFATGSTLDLLNTLHVSELISSPSNMPTFNQTGSGTYDGIISGSGSLVKMGTGSLNLSGAHTYTGTTTVSSGTLHVDGSLNSSVILNDGVFGGNVSLNASNLTVNGGMVSPGGDNLYGTINVGNNLLFSGGGMFDAEVDSVGNTDSISAAGTAALNGTLDIQAAVGNFLAGEMITLIDATGGVSGTFSTEIIPPHPNGSPLFEVQYNPNSVDLLVLQDLVFDSASTGQTINSGNPQAVVDYMLSQLPIDPTSDFGFVIESLGLVPNNQINKALNLMHPGSFALLESMNLTTNAQIMEVFSGHFFGAPASPAETISQLEPTLTAATGDQPFYSDTPVRRGCGRDINNHHNVWLQPFGTWNTQSQKGELRGTNYESVGIMTGYDYLFENFYVGAGLGYAYTNFRWHGTAGKGHINQVYGGLTGSYFMKYFAATLSTMVGGNYYNTDRYIRYNAPNHPTARLNRTAHSHSSGIQWTNHLGLVGQIGTLGLNSISAPLQIFGNLDHFYLHNGSFNENGANSLNMRVNSKTSNALRSELGLSSSYTFHVSGGCWTPYARISWVNKTLLSSSSYRGGFRGQVGTFSVSASSKGSNQWAPGVGVEFANVHGFSLLMNTRAELSGKMKNYSADMRMDYTF